MSASKLAHAFKWSLASEVAAKAVQPIVFIVLARLLTPADFGVMSAALMVIGFSQIVWEAGMAKALIQRQTDTEDAANVAFWINVGLAAIVASALFLAARPVAQSIFHDLRVMPVLQFMTIHVLLGALSSVHSALLQKDMQFRRLFWVRFATVSIPGLAAIPLAWNGTGYWALVAGSLVGQTTQVVMLWRSSRWRPSTSFRVDVAAEMLRFGAWVGATGLLAWFYVWADSLVVGMYLGSHYLGLYQTGNQFANLAFALLFAPVAPVFYTHLSRMRLNKSELRRAAEQVIKTITLISIPIALILFSMAEQLSGALFGNKWQGIHVVIGAMVLMHGFSWVVGLNGEVYRAMGRPSWETIVSAFSLLAYAAAYLFSIRYGLEAFVWTRFGLALGAVLLHLLVIRAILSMPIRPVVGYLCAIVSICALPVLAVRYFLIENIEGNWSSVLLGGAANVALVGSILYLVERRGIMRDLRSAFALERT